jgi:hypothetical protein
MITEWIDTFKSTWLRKDIEEVLTLFSDDVEYWESPFQQVSVGDLPKLWSTILTQENTELSIERLMSGGAQHILRWKLTYDSGNDIAQWAGIYIVMLNIDGKCEYFYQVGEKA